MNPTELRDLLLYAPRTEENYRKLPPDALGIWCSAPSKSNIDQAKWGANVRSILIAAAFLYIVIFQRFNGDALALVFVLAGYEFAYSTLRKEKNTLDSILASERYQSNVDEFLTKKHPGYKPPAG